VDNVTAGPDGIVKEMHVFNNTFPGPTIEANWGDTIKIHVKNNLQNNGYHLNLSN
jgi:FtsP/CotA-like multicopper oxidase with cupredoxin domain